ncbi:hypothetical protein [Duganella vulcania]|uniref:Uncharacterized protein n=1 Tax=Duganella vulcania TaxID=2692166 RepID=A0A845GGK7_9BURK|nr:hypothetical protein [Duganella vulcania]MYM92525.1 hypothetical protein [Duganella vulcania]
MSRHFLHTAGSTDTTAEIRRGRLALHLTSSKTGYSRWPIVPLVDNIRIDCYFTEGGSAGFILPAYVLQTSTSVNRMHERWSIEQNLLPRNLFPRLKLPIVWAAFTKERTRRLVGFFLYGEAAEIAQLQKDCRRVAESSGQGQTWRTVTRFALQMLGGEANLDEIYCAIEPRRPSMVNRSWQARVRNVLQKSGDFLPVQRGRWRIAPV